MLCQMDDVLIFGSDKAQHDQRLTAVLKRLQTTGVTLNSERCEFVKICVKFLGHVIDPEGTEGIRPDRPREDFCDCQDDSASQRPQVTSFPRDG